MKSTDSSVADLDLRFSHNVGTPEIFMKVASQNPMVLHFICHGIVSKQRVCSLVLQNVDGSGSFITTKSLNKMLEISKAKLDIVFLSACHSEGAAQAFLDSGASHVICIKKENQVLDEACVLFS